MWRFYYYFYQCAIIKTGKAWSIALRGKNRTKLACLVKILEIFMSKNHFLVKKSRTVMRTVKRSKMYLLITRERIEISQKFQRIWIQQDKSNFPE
jgi:hypothetical protein